MKANKFENHPDIHVGNGAIVKDASFFIRVASMKKDKPRIIVGENSILKCTCVLETETAKISIGSNTFIGAQTSFDCATEIIVGSDVLIAGKVLLMDHDSHSIVWEERKDDFRLWYEGLQTSIEKACKLKKWELVPQKRIMINDKAWIGIGSMILKGVIIGEGAVVAAGSVVTQNVPAWVVVGGNPAKKIKEIRRENREDV